MDNNFYTDDLERLLKEKSDEFRMYPSKRVWHSLYNDLHPSRRWPSVTISMLLVLVLMLTGYLNTNDTDTSNRTQLVQYDISVHSNNTATHNLKKDKVPGKLYATGIGEEENSTPAEDAGTGEQPLLDLVAAEPSIAGIASELSLANDGQAVNVNSVAADESRMSNGFPLLLIRDKNIYNTFAVRGFNSTNHLTYNWASSSPAETNTVFPGNNNTAATGTIAFNTPADKAKTATNGRSGVYNKAAIEIISPAENVTPPHNNGGNTVATNSNRNKTNKTTAARNTTRSNKNSPASVAKTNTGNNTNNEITGSLTSDAPTTTGDNNALTTTTTKATEKAADAVAAKENGVAHLLVAGKGLSNEEKAWIEDFAFHNKPVRKKWKDQVVMEFYATPSISYRFATNEIEGQNASAFASNDINRVSNQKPGLGLEAGAGIAYAFAKNLRFKAGVQLNYTNYGIKARETNHPILTSLLMNDPVTGLTYSSTRPSTLINGNVYTGQAVILRNRTYQVSIPLGLAYKLASNKKIDWYAGASIQPSYVFGGNAYLLTADLKNYVNEPSALRRWNFNTGIETYIHYKIGSMSIQAGPQFRYQLQSTYGKQYTTSEKLYNIGLKLGIVKGF